MAGGIVTFSDDTVEDNSCQYGYQNEVLRGVASAGGIDIAEGATVYIDAFTLAHTINNGPQRGERRRESWGRTSKHDGVHVRLQ